MSDSTSLPDPQEQRKKQRSKRQHGSDAPARETPQAVVPEERQCPSCFHGYGGVGKSYATRGGKRYYKCPECSHTWVFEFVVQKTGIVINKTKKVMP